MDSPILSSTEVTDPFFLYCQLRNRSVCYQRVSLAAAYLVSSRPRKKYSTQWLFESIRRFKGLSACYSKTIKYRPVKVIGGSVVILPPSSVVSVMTRGLLPFSSPKATPPILPLPGAALSKPMRVSNPS